MKTLAEATGVVSRPPAEVLDWLRRHLCDDYPMRMEVDVERGMVAVQGGWWYRGEYFVSPAPAGSRVTHRVVNAAERGAWGVSLANGFFRGYRENVARGFALMLVEIGGGVGGTPAGRVR